MIVSIPSFEKSWSSGQREPARIRILEVTDKNKVDESPIARLLVERVETVKKDFGNDEQVVSANIRLHCYLLLPERTDVYQKHCQFDGHYSVLHNLVSITSRSLKQGMVALDLEGLKSQRIGTYLMNEVVAWAKQWPNAGVHTIRLLMGQADIENKERRNRFYEQFNIAFDYGDAERQVGESLPMKAGDLSLVTSWKQNIKELSVHGYLEQLLQSQKNLQWELDKRNDANRRLYEKLQTARQQPKSSWWMPKLSFVLATAGLSLLTWTLILK